MFETLGALRFNNKLNKAAKVVCKELELNYVRMVSPLGNKWEMMSLFPILQDLQYYCKEEKWNEYQLGISMFLNGLGDDQIIGSSPEHYEKIVNRIRWWGNIGVISTADVETSLNYFASVREQ